ncbi:unannotated protein [freshwater metagenome]
MTTAEFGALLREPSPEPQRVPKKREPGDDFDEAFRD